VVAGLPLPFLPWAEAIGDMAIATTMATSAVINRFMCPPLDGGVTLTKELHPVTTRFAPECRAFSHI